MRRKLTKEEFIERARKAHGDKYDYSKVEYVNNKTKICIICSKHGEFYQTPNDHLTNHGCPNCKNDNLSEQYTKSWKTLINDFRDVHGDKYEYDESTYTNAHEKMRIVCPIHGEFWMRPYAHLNGQGCPKCSHRGYKYNTKEWIRAAKEIHGDKYDYSKVKYINKDTKICIICPKHGEFYQTPHNHLNGQGCPKCANSKLESKIRTFLETNNIEHTIQYTNKEILGLQRLDFFLPKYNIGIECQGEQHFTPIDFGGLGKEWAEELFKINKERDENKLNKCSKNGIKLYHYFENQNHFGTYENELHSLEELEKLLTEANNS
jgi:predicted  nucleic acid-binding Zn-ribbon protein